MLEELIEKSADFDSRKWDVGPAEASDNFSFHPVTAELVLPPTLDSAIEGIEAPRAVPMTWHAFKQVCGRLGLSCWPGQNKTLPAEYLAACPESMRARQLNYWLGLLPHKYNGPREWFVRGYEGEVRGVLTERYSTIDVTETLRWTKEALDSKGDGLTPVIHNPIVTPDVLHLRVLFKDINTNGGASNYAIGGYFTTGEIGNRKIGAYPLVQRHSCTNSIVIPHDEFMWEHTHTGTRSVLKHLFMAAIFEVLKGAVDALDRLLKAEQEYIPDFTRYIDNLADEHGWLTETRDQVLIGSEGHESLFGVVQGISAAANRVLDPDEQADMQLLAGQVLYARAR